MSSRTEADPMVKVYVELIICLDDHTWYLADTVIEMNWWDYEENLDNSFVITRLAQKNIVIPENFSHFALYNYQEVVGGED